MQQSALLVDALTQYRAITRTNLRTMPEWSLLSADQQEAVMVVSTVLPFRTNQYVVRELIDWNRVPDDPFFQLNFGSEDMLAPADYRRVADLLRANASKPELEAAAHAIRRRLNPQPDGQLTHNVPSLDGRPLAGLQHKYRDTVLFFPNQGQTCHSYCTFCFRWAQFVGLDELKFEARETHDLVRYLRAHPEVTEVLITGGDPMIMRTSALRYYIEPLLDPELDHVNLRIGTKSVANWPYRYLTDPDADDVLRLFEQIVARGRHLAIMAHYNHPRELQTPMAQRAVARIRSTGAQIRTQSPLIRRINDQPETWAELWTLGVRLGCIPYYMFVERDTGPRHYFEVPLVRAWEIFRLAYQRVSGLARTVRGPVMSALPGKVLVEGLAEVAGEQALVLAFIQARDPDWVRRPFFAKPDPKATWLDDLRPAFGATEFFFAREMQRFETARRLSLDIM